ncbi:MAG: TonB-dependent receptor plug domain-containing protein [Verrucomicrobiota bacterium]
MNEHYALDKARLFGGAFRRCFAAALALASVSSVAFAQDDDEEDEIFELSPFQVDGSQDDGYRATSTLAGSRIRTDLKDVGSAITVVTKEFLEDVGAIDNETLLAYTPSTEVGGTFGNYTGVGNGISINERGNFNNPNSNTRVRGLAAADNTRDYFISDIPWDGFIVDRVDMQRGPNAILFGLGSPAGIVNVTTHDAVFADQGRAEVRVGSYGSLRGTVRKNFVILEDELAAKVAVVSDQQKFRQDPAFDDDNRAYLAFKWKPSFLNGERTRFTAKANYENGSITSNRPRTVTPQDNITPFFNPVGRVGADPESGVYELGTFPDTPGLGRMTFHPADVRNASKGLGFNQIGKTVEVLGEDVANPYYIPAIGNYGQVFGGPVFFFDSVDSTALSSVMVTEFNDRGGLNSTGGIDGTIDGNDYTRLTSVADYADYAGQNGANLEWAQFGQYKNAHLSDPSIFNFYDLLFDGPNKSEWADWDAITASIEHTFLDGTVGYELAFFDQTYTDGRVGITGFNDSIFIDTNSHLTDGSVNPNVGRPFISDSAEGGNRVFRSERESIRFTAYAEHDFTKKNDNWLTRLVGLHRLTGLKSTESRFTDSRDFHRYRMEDAYYERTGDPRWVGSSNLVNTSHYIGPSLLNTPSASGLNLSNVTSAHELPSSVSVYMFDSTWNSTVDPGADWDNAGSLSTQSENPANYVGWTSYEFGVLNALEGNNMDQMISSGNLSEYEVESEAAVWQGWLLNGAVVGMYGWREDTLDTWNANAPELPNGYRDVSPGAYNLDFDATQEGGESTSYSLVAHINELPGMDWLPFEMSASYSSSENFQPGAGRRDMFGQELPAPFGETTDKSLYLATKDNRFSLKITDYETSVNESESSYIDGTWFVGRFVAWGENWRNVYAYNITNGFSDDDEFISDGTDNLGWRYNLQGPDGSFDQAFEDKAVSDWRDFTNAIAEEFPTYFDAWSMQGIGTEVKEFNSSDPAGLTYTQNAISSGTEFEFNAKLSDNWDITMNASKTEAVRNDVGGAAMIEWVNFVDRWFEETNAGDIRIWSAGGPTIKNEWNNTFRSSYSLTELLEGTATPEIREWRFNAWTRYKLTEGRFKGVEFGGGARWQDEIILGYQPELDAEGRVTYDLNTPYVGPDELAIDFFANYSKKLENGMRWKIQINIRDLFADDDLIPLSTQANGDWAALRIPAERTWSLTNTFEF